MSAVRNEISVYSTSRAVHIMAIDKSYKKGMPLAGFEIPKDTVFIRVRIRDVFYRQSSEEVLGVFELDIMTGEPGCEFKGWI